MYYQITYTEENYIEETVKGYDFNMPNSMSKLDYLQYRDKSNLVFEKLKYPINQEWNDYVGCSYMNSNFSALVSNEFKELLSKFKVVDHSFVETKIAGPLGTFKGYNLLLLNQGVGEFVNFDQSDIYLYKGFNRPEEKCNVEDNILINHINGIERYIQSNDLRARKVIMKQSFDFDMFSVFGLGRGLTVSERLKNEIEKSQLKGIEFRPSNVVRQDYSNKL